jgi:hypothetical protein
MLKLSKNSKRNNIEEKIYFKYREINRKNTQKDITITDIFIFKE